MSWRESPAETGLDIMQFKSTPKVHMSNPRLYGTYYICNQKDCNRVEPGAIQWRRSRHLQYCETLWNNHTIITAFVLFFGENQTNLNNPDWKIMSVIVYKYSIIYRLCIIVFFLVVYGTDTFSVFIWWVYIVVLQECILIQDVGRREGDRKGQSTKEGRL